MSEGAGGGTSGQDDDIERRLRELTEEIAGKARPREPSAAERAAAAARTSQPDKPRRPKRSRTALKAWAIAIVVLAAGAGITWLHLSSSSKSALNDTQPVRNGPVPTASPSRMTVGNVPNSQSGPPADPFAGTPAEHYADGAAGIVVPGARPTGDFTAAQVKAAYTDTRKVLIAADLDGQTLRGGAPDAFANLLIPQERSDFVEGLDKIGLDKQGFELSTRAWVVSFAPGSTEFIGTTIKVHGVMSAGTTTDNGRPVLRIDFNYIFVYPIEPPHLPADWMRVVGHAHGDVEFAQWDDPGGSLEPWVQMDLDRAGIRCGIGDGYIHPDFPQGPPSKVTPSGKPVNPYSLATPPSTSSCQRTTGT
jgi:hypothetical protein